MGIFDILGTFRIFLCAAMLWKFSEKLYTQGKYYCIFRNFVYFMTNRKTEPSGHVSG